MGTRLPDPCAASRRKGVILDSAHFEKQSDRLNLGKDEYSKIV
jgi:hypothetical protein